MESTRDVLDSIKSVPGISAAVCVGRDGFVIDSASDSSTDVEMLGATVSTGMGSSETIGRELDVGTMFQAMLEYDAGIVMMAGIGEDAILAVLAGTDASLGNIRLQIRKNIPRLLDAL